MKQIIVFFFLCLSLSIVPTTKAIERPEIELEEAGLSPKLGKNINLELSFQNSNNNSIKLKDLVQENKPLIIIPAYYSCPRLCGLLLNGAQKLFQELDLKLGQDYSVATVSFNKKDNHLAARGQEIRYRSGLGGDSGNPDAWHFLVGEEAQINELMTSLGFGFKKDKEDFAHSAALFILTPSGQLSQAFTGVDFSPKDVKLAMVAASGGSIGSIIDHVMLFCYRFDPLQGRYTFFAQNMLRVGGAITLFFLAGLIILLRYRERIAAK